MHWKGWEMADYSDTYRNGGLRCIVVEGNAQYLLWIPLLNGFWFVLLVSFFMRCPNCLPAKVRVI